MSNNSTGGLWLKSFNKSASDGAGGYFTSYSENDLTTYSSFEFVAKKHNGAGGLTSHGNSARIFSIINNTTNLFNVLGSGNVGIGTANPAMLLGDSNGLHISGSYPGFRLTATATGGHDYFLGTGSNGQLVLYDNTSAATRMFFSSSGNVGIGTTNPQYKLDVNGNTNVTGDINVTGNINAKYQDVAEWVPSSERLAAGTVVVLDTAKSNQVVSSSTAYDTRVAGVISAQPGIALGEKSDNKVLVATTGRVRVKVDASKSPIQIGDLLVTSDIPGVAMKSEAVNLGGVQIHRPGTIIGKALEPLAKGSGEILVLLSLQ